MNEIMSILRHRMGTDGEGVTTLVAFYGCPLNCQYCINRQCIEENTLRYSVSASSLLKKIEIDDIYFKMTGGGVTFGGGEPLLSSEFIREFCRNADRNWKIRIETSLNVEWSKFDGLISNCDMWYVDIKDRNPDIYRAYTGKDNALVLENLKRLSREAGKENITVRVPHIPGYNTKEDVEKTISFAKEYACSVEIFKYIVC